MDCLRHCLFRPMASVDKDTHGPLPKDLPLSLITYRKQDLCCFFTKLHSGVSGGPPQKGLAMASWKFGNAEQAHAGTGPPHTSASQTCV